jgi:hypothetical protein
MGEFKEMTVELDSFWETLRRKIAGSDCCNDNGCDSREDRALLLDTLEPKISGYLVQPRSDAWSRTPFDADQESN